MDIPRLYQKALLQAKFGRLDAAESTLRELLTQTEPAQVARIRALVTLGDLLYHDGREAEAMPLLESALHEAPAAQADDLLDHELDRARTLRSEYRGSPRFRG